MTITFELDGEFQVKNMYNQLMGVVTDAKKGKEEAKKENQKVKEKK